MYLHNIKKQSKIKIFLHFYNKYNSTNTNTKGGLITFEKIVCGKKVSGFFLYNTTTNIQKKKLTNPNNNEHQKLFQLVEANDEVKPHTTCSIRGMSLN